MKFLIVVLENFSLCNSTNNFKKLLSSVLFQKSDIKVLGRWNMESDDSIVNTKIDLSNYDHCGSCGLSKQSPRFQDKPRF
jgi:hypothetical protein